MSLNPQQINELSLKFKTLTDKLSGTSTQLIAVIKKQPLEKIEWVIQKGIRHIGINYVQEGDALQTQIKSKYPELTWHYIGRIQSNKLRKIVSSYDYIHTITKQETIEKIQGLTQELGRSPSLFAQVNIGNEGSKDGIPLEEADRILKGQKKNSPLSGLMILPPPLFPVEKREPYFKQVRDYVNNLNQNLQLSMGTSNDYSLAVKYQSDFVRIGEALLGQRN